MQELERILLAHASQYPQMQPQDAIKLIFQNEFGGGHILPDMSASLESLRQELDSIAGDDTAPICEAIGNGLCRLNLYAAKNKYSASLVNRLFVASATRTQGNAQSFINKLALLEQLTLQGQMPFSVPSFVEYLQAYRAAGYPLVRHSDPFRETYHPAYRIVDQRYMRYLSLFSAIDKLLSTKGGKVISIDGRCGSGKSTLADLIAEVYDSSIIRMDDFFLPMSLRTDARLGEAGGNIHYERFLSEVVTGLRSNQAFEYRRYDCSVMDFAEQPISVVPKQLTIVEGTYSQHPLFRHIYDVRVFMTCAPQVQQQRLLDRGGPALLKRFNDEWIPMEERYFEICRIPEGCDLVFTESNDEQMDDGRLQEYAD